MSQAVVGATAPEVVPTERLSKEPFASGAVGGLLPDVDALIRSTSDPLPAVEMYRPFRQALGLAPIGGLVSALPFLTMRVTAGAGERSLLRVPEVAIPAGPRNAEECPPTG